MVIELANVDMAYKIAFKAHAGQYDKAGQPYIQHPAYVASQMKSDDERMVALLHDVIEDTPLTLDDLRQKGFSDEVVNAVYAITKVRGEDYADYLNRVRGNRLACSVKIADLLHNSDLSRLSEIKQMDYERVEKYKHALAYLQA